MSDGNKTASLICISGNQRNFRDSMVSSNPMHRVKTYEAVEFETFGVAIAGYKRTNSVKKNLGEFVSFFGIEPCFVAMIWILLIDSGHFSTQMTQPKPEHLLWTLLFLRMYMPVNKLATLCQCNQKTFMKWVWFYLEGIASLDEMMFVSIR